MLHKDALASDIHIVHNWAVADAAALAALVPIAGDNGKVAWQQDNNTFYVLADYVAPTWVLLNTPGFANPMTTVGDIVYGEASGTPTRLPGNISLTRRVLSQKGDGTAAGDPEWVPELLSGNAEFIFSGTASDIATYYAALAPGAYTSAALQTIGAVASTTPTLLASFATGSGFPNATRIPLGLVRLHLQVQKTSGADAYTVYAEIYKRVLAGTETLLETTASSVSTASNALQNLTLTVEISPEVALLATDRIVVKVYAVMAAATATVSVLFDSTTTTRLELPALAADSISYVPYNGATADVNLGSKNLIANEVTAGGVTLSDRAKGLPQDSKSADYTLVLGDAGKHLLHPSADTTARTFTIPANSSVAFPIGTVVSFVNQNAAGIVSIAITTDTMRLAGAGSTGTRSLAANGIATAIKLTSTEWIISGVGLT